MKNFHIFSARKNFHSKRQASERKEKKEKEEKKENISPLFRNTSRSNERLKSVPRGPSGIAF